jgi:3-oxoacyl-[acyl-carrier protein] reductase
MNKKSASYQDIDALKGKVTLVTGATGGIGKEICEKFAELGSFVYICDIKESIELADYINEKYETPRSSAIPCDISDKEKVREMYNKIKKENNGVDILINNAAVHGIGDFPEISYNEFLKTIQIDLCGAMYCTLMVLPYMKKNRWGKLIFTGAPLSSSGIPCSYLAGKSAFIGLAKYISKKYKRDNIRTFTLVLRHCDTPMIRRVIISRGKSVEEGIRELHSKSKTGKMITPKEVAELYAYFCLNDSSNINGLTLLSDGGITYL